MLETPASLIKVTEDSIYDKIREAAASGSFSRIIVIQSNEKTVNYLKNRLEQSGLQVSLTLNYLQSGNHRLYISWSL